MSARFVLILIALSIFGFDHAASAASKKRIAAAAKSAHKVTNLKSASSRKRISSGHIAHRLVPPPPAYMPSILPELYYSAQSANTQSDESDTDEVAEKPSNPYAKYFYSREGEAPKGTQARSGVTTWAALR